MGQRQSPRALTPQEREEAFRIATKCLPTWFADEIANGMSDAELAEALKSVLGIWGGSYGPGKMDIVFQGSGLRIWAGWHIVDHATERPIWQGQQTIAMARVIYDISDPEDRQQRLL